MQIICIYRKENDCIAFIAPFYAGDCIHECKIILSGTLKDTLEGHQDLINNGRRDLNKLEFDDYKEAHKHAFNAVFNGLDYSEYFEE
jgi:2-hydroxy-3-keto-5-methylthiopentenyl-1-phosphate phosphatase